MVTINKPIDNNNCQTGTPNGILINIPIGDVNGIIDNHTLTFPDGLSITIGKHIIAKINGTVIGKVN